MIQTPTYIKKAGILIHRPQTLIQRIVPSENREDGADDTECGECLSGFTEDDTGVCVADAINDEGTNWLMIGGGIATVVVIGFFLMNK